MLSRTGKINENTLLGEKRVNEMKQVSVSICTCMFVKVKVKVSP